MRPARLEPTKLILVGTRTTPNSICQITIILCIPHDTIITLGDKIAHPLAHTTKMVRHWKYFVEKVAYI